MAHGFSTGRSPLGSGWPNASLTPMSESASIPVGDPDPAPGERAALQLRRHADGDRGAFAELVADHHGAAFATAARILGDADLAADVVQEAFLRVLRHGERFDETRPFRPWLLQIVRNLAIDALRRRRRHQDVDRLGDLAAPAAGCDGVELRACVATVLADLPEKYRVLIVLRELEGVPAEAIAERIGIDYGTTRWRLHEARRLFRAAWISRYGEDR